LRGIFARRRLKDLAGRTVLGGVEDNVARVILLDPCEASRGVLARRLRAQGYAVEPAADPAAGADMALSAPPMAVVADLWMPSISGVQLCRLLRSEPATADVPVILRGDADDPRSRFWAVRAGAAAYVTKGRMGELVRELAKASRRTPSDSFFMQLSGGALDIRERIAQHLDAALFESVLAAEIRALATCGSLDRLFDLLSQFFAQVHSYRWLGVLTLSPPRFALHHHPRLAEAAEREARAALGVPDDLPVSRIEDEDATDHAEGPPCELRHVLFGSLDVGRVAVGPSPAAADGCGATLDLVARDLGGAIRMAALVEESQRLALTDSLTGLANRRAFLAAVELEHARAVRHGYPLTLVLVDIDHFKQINDRHGHASGDRALAEVGALLRASLRVNDVPARWGGEEFVFALPSTDRRGGQVVAERVREALEALEISDASGGRIPVTASFGVASLEPHETLSALLDRADRAMYLAKTSGRNRVVASGEPPKVVADVA
jgi:two-component system, cell cycle response regulator